MNSSEVFHTMGEISENKDIDGAEKHFWNEVGRILGENF